MGANTEPWGRPFLSCRFLLRAARGHHVEGSVLKHEHDELYKLHVRYGLEQLKVEAAQLCLSPKTN